MRGAKERSKDAIAGEDDGGWLTVEPLGDQSVRGLLVPLESNAVCANQSVATATCLCKLSDRQAI